MLGTPETHQGNPKEESTLLPVVSALIAAAHDDCCGPRDYKTIPAPGNRP
ncbi:hypothetical protein CGRA01v4_06934 [Colletotrichum graminicola]|nr:hypothetical protein CGRA01v4_06934 [Colletotrichum graminicola]